MQYMELDKKDSELLACLELISPGTDLRDGLDHIIHGKTGGLIVIGDTPDVLENIEGGFRIECEFLPTRIYELAKMDGAIILSSDLKRILYANAYIRPNLSIPTRETGMRHQAAERIARQTGKMAIAISQRRGTVTLFIGHHKYILRELTALIAGANQTLLTLDRYIEALNTALSDLDRSEVTRTVTLSEVVSLIQRVEMVRRAESELNRYRIELGDQAQALQLRHPEVTWELGEGLLVIRDYYRQGYLPEKEIFKQVFNLSVKQLSESSTVSAALGYPRDIAGYVDFLVPRGYRMLSRIHRLPMTIVENLVEKFHNLYAIADASLDELQQVEGVGEIRAAAIKKGLEDIGFGVGWRKNGVPGAI